MSPSSAIQPFTFPDTGHPVRTVDIGGEPWFVVADVCKILGLTNPTVAADRIDPDGLSTAEVIDTLGRRQAARVASEPGLYELIFQSRKPEARSFRRWITREVLPEIRRTGRYEVAPAAPAVPASFAEALELAAAQARELETAHSQVAELTPAADAWDALAAAEGDYALREAAQLLSRDPSITIGQKRLAAYLRQIGWTDSTSQPYQRHVDLGRLARRTRTYEHPRTREEQVATQMRITARGVRELRDRLIQGAQLAIDGGTP